MKFRCAMCDKVKPVVGCTIRNILGLRSRVCADCKAKLPKLATPPKR